MARHTEACPKTCLSCRGLGQAGRDCVRRHQVAGSRSVSGNIDREAQLAFAFAVLGTTRVRAIGVASMTCDLRK